MPGLPGRAPAITARNLHAAVLFDPASRLPLCDRFRPVWLSLPAACCVWQSSQG